VILSHAEILSRRIAFANQILLCSQICDGEGVTHGAFSNRYVSANAVRGCDFHFGVS
jgi:hypothetical protein